jgi:UPF0755 protein
VEQGQPRRSDRHGDPDGRSHRGAFLALLVAFLVLVGGVVAAGAYYGHCKGASGPKREVSFTVEPGTSGEEVVSRLHDLGVVRCDGIMGRILLRATGRAGEIRAGSYALTTNMTLDEAVDVLSTPPAAVPTVRLTIPEGYRLTQIADRVRQELGIAEDQFLTLAQSKDWSLDPYLPSGKGTEGFLFPETYEFVKKGTTANDVIRKLLDQFAVEARNLPFANATALGLTPYQIVIVASMIEKEVKVDADRPLVAAVIYNRLSHDMTLGFDSTVAYIDPNPADGLTSADFRIHSPYNTRLSAGLPPTPIASPGRASLAASLSPAHTTDLYFLDCRGRDRLVFSSTYDQFLRDKAACLG